MDELSPEAPKEDALARAERQVREAQDRVALQEELVTFMAEDDYVLPEAERLLGELRKALALARQHLHAERERRGLPS
jgi:hypothetical protein